MYGQSTGCDLLQKKISSKRFFIQNVLFFIMNLIDFFY